MIYKCLYYVFNKYNNYETENKLEGKKLFKDSI